MKITVYNEKGGAGKTTLAVLLAVLLEAELIDLDAQKSSQSWLGQRKDPHQAKPGNWVIDCPPGLSMETAAAISDAEIVLIPVRASFNDLIHLPQTVKFVRTHGAKKVAFVGSDIDSRTNDEATLREALGGYGYPIAGILTHRASYRRAGLTGGLASDSDPAAAAEAAALITSLQELSA